jgi:hypothetical protein
MNENKNARPREKEEPLSTFKTKKFSDNIINKQLMDFPS